jgi:hypothetical protein
MQHFDTLKGGRGKENPWSMYFLKSPSLNSQSPLRGFTMLAGQALRGPSSHDGRLHIKRFTSFAATDKQEPIASPSSDTTVLEDTERSAADSSTSGCSYSTHRGVGKPGFISFHGGSSQKVAVESVPHPGKEASRLVWFVGPTILVAFLVLPSLYLRKVLAAVFEDSLLTGILSVIVQEYVLSILEFMSAMLIVSFILLVP